MSEFNQDHYWSPLEKLYFFICGLIIAMGVIYITHLYFEYRVVNATWETVFVSPEVFWQQVPDWSWEPVFQVK
jgi:hypothetical protein